MDKVKFTSKEYQKHLDFWRNIGPVTEDFEISVNKTLENPSFHQSEITIKYREQIDALSKGKDMGVYVLISALAGILLKSFTGKENVVLHTPKYVSGERSNENRPIPLIVKTHDELSLRECLNNLKEYIKNCHKYQDLPYLDAESPVDQLYQTEVLLAYNSVHETSSIDNNYQLIIEVDKASDEFRLLLKYNILTISKAFIESFGSKFNSLLQEFSKLDTKIGDVDVLTEEERALQKKWGTNTIEFDRLPVSLPQIPENAARTSPDNVALIDGDVSLTYQDLNARANQLSSVLIDHYDVKPNDRVGIILENRTNYVISILAVLKAGATYVPIDPNYPISRVQFVATDAELKNCIIDVTFKSLFSGTDIDTLLWSDLQSLSAQKSIDKLETAYNPEGAAYIIYTSGTTGHPKGVVVSHKSVINTIYGLKTILPIPSNPKLNFTTSFSFDASVKSVFLTFLNTGSLILEGELQDVEGIAANIKKYGINMMHATPTMWRELVGLGFKKETFESLKCVSSGGEKLTAKLANEIRNLTSTEVYNLYGPTETSINSLYYKVKPHEKNDPPVGRPLPNYEVLLLNDQLKEVPVRGRGEICFRGVGVAQGYTDPSINDKFTLVNGDKVYRTGDLGTWTDEGNIVFLGRKDSQVKINGYRIELDEIERVLQKVNGINDLILLKESEGERDSLLCFYKGDATSDGIRQSAMAELPFYMIPTQFIKVKRIPFYPNGKLNKELLKEARLNTQDVDIVEPSTEVEAELLEVFKQVAETESVGVKHDFFQVGGNSIKATKLLYEIEKRFAVSLKLKQVFQNPTVYKLAQLVENSEKKDSVFDITKAPQSDLYDASYGQHRQWIVDQNPLEHQAYTMSSLLRVDGHLDVSIVEHVFRLLIEKHESLRTTFSLEGETLKQKIHQPDAFEFELEKFDLSKSDNKEAEVLQCIHKLEEIGFDLEKGPLLKVALFELSASEFRLFITLDHIVSDGWSMQVLIKDFITLYDSLKRNEKVQVKALPIQYKDFANWQNNKLSKAEYTDKWKSFWSQEFSGKLPLLNLPVKHERPNQKSFKGAVLNTFVSKELFNGIKAICHDYQVTPYVFFLATLNHFLYKLTKQQDIIVGTGASGRVHPVLQNQVGLFANIVPVRSQISENQSFTDLLKSTKEKVINCLDNQEYPFLKMLEDFDVKWETNRSPLFDVMMMFQESRIDAFKIEGLTIEEVDLPSESSLFDLYFNIVEYGEDFSISINYDSALFDKETAQYLQSGFINILQAVVEKPADPLDNFSVSNSVTQITSPESTLILNTNNSQVGLGEVGKVHLRADILKTKSDVVEVNGVEYYSTGMDGRLGFDGKLEVLDLYPEYLIYENECWLKEDIESSFCTFGEFADCKVLNQWVNGRKKLVAHVASNDILDVALFKGSGVSATLISQVIFNQVPGFPYDEDGFVDIEALSAYPIIPSESIESIEKNALEQVGGIKQIACLTTNVYEKSNPIYLSGLGQKSLAKENEKPSEEKISYDNVKNKAYSNGGKLGVGDNPVSMQEALLAVSKNYPDKGIFLVKESRNDNFLSYKELVEVASLIAGGLRENDVNQKETVLLQCKDYENILPAFWGCVMGGFIPVIVSTPNGYRESGMVLDKVYNAWCSLGKPVILTDNPDEVKNISAVYNDSEEVKALGIDDLKQQGVTYVLAKANAGDVAFYQLTSGSTGKSKCIPETHLAITEHVLGAKEYNGLLPTDVTLNWMPHDHVGAILTYHLKSLYLGQNQVHIRTEVILEEPLLWFEYLEKYNVTHTWSPNFGYRLVINSLKEQKGKSFDLSSMKHFLNGGEQVTMGVVKEFLDITQGFNLHQYCMQPAFGMAEVATAFIYNNHFDDNSVIWVDNNSLNGSLKFSTAEKEGYASFIELGPPMPGIEIRITDDQNEVLPEGVIGRFQIRGNSVMPGYLENLEANKEAFVGEGWFNSGDLGFIRDGKLTLTGREKEMIIVRGNNFYCFEIEDFVSQIEGVLPTYVAVCPYKEADDTEGFMVFYVPANEDEFLNYDLIEDVKLRIAKNFKISPEYVIPCEKKFFPKTTSGKIQRIKLQQSFEKGDFGELVRSIDIETGNDKKTLPSWFFEKVWVHKNLKQQELKACSPVLLFVDNDQQIDQWNQFNKGSVFIKKSDKYEVSESHVTIRPFESGDYQRVLNSLDDKKLNFNHIIYLWSFTSEISESKLLTQSQEELTALLKLYQTLESRLEQVNINVVRFESLLNTKSDTSNVSKGVVSGFIKSASEESQNVQFSQIDFELGEHCWPQKTMNEMLNGCRDKEVAYRKSGRLVSKLKKTTDEDMKRVNSSRKFEKNGSYLLLGGLGNIGQKIGEYLLENYQATLLIIGKTNLKTDSAKSKLRAQTLQALKGKSKGQVYYETLDAGNIEALNRFVESVEASIGRKIDGIINLTGEVDSLDKHIEQMEANMLSNMKPESFTSMLSTKVGSLLSSTKLLDTRPNIWFVNFSTALTYFGGASASSYVAASAFQDAYLLLQNELNPNIINLNFTMWNTSGEEESAGAGWFTHQKGFINIPVEQAIKSLMVGLSYSQPQLYVGLDISNDLILPEVVNTKIIKKRLLVFYASEKDEDERIRLSSLVQTHIPSEKKVEIKYIEREHLPEDDEHQIVKKELYLLKEVASTDNNLMPRTDVQKALLAIWKNILKIESVDLTSNFFSLGGDSLKATQILARIKKQFQVKVELRDIFENPTVLMLSEMIENATRDSLKINRIKQSDYYEVSYAQRRLWLACQTDKLDTSYNTFSAFQLEGKLDKAILEKSITAFIKRHEIARTNIISVEGEPKQVVRDWTYRAYQIDTNQVDEDCDLNIEELCRLEYEQPFDLENDLLIRFKLLKKNDESHVLLFTMHHIISDAWSLSIIAREIVNGYEDIKQNLAFQQQPLEINYKDFAKWQVDYLENGGAVKHRAYWKKRFGEQVPTMEFPADYQRPEQQTLNGDSVYVSFERDTLGKLREASKVYESSNFILMLSAIKALFYRYVGQEDILLKTPVSGRTEEELEGQVGFYINTLPLYSRVQEGISFEELIRQITTDTLESYKHQSYPFDHLIEDFKIKKENNRSPLSDIVILYLNSTEESKQAQMSDINISEINLATRINKFDLRIVLGESLESVQIKIDYNTDLYKRETIELLAKRIVIFINALIDNPSQKISEVELDEHSDLDDNSNEGALEGAFEGFSFN